MKTIIALSAVVLFGVALAACSRPLPICPTEELIAPILAAPADGASVNTLSPSLTWGYPANCTPQGYRIDLSITADFSDTSLSGGTGNPSTTWGPGAPLTDCTVYYWRVAPINDTTLGPFSASWSFKTDAAGTCSPPPPLGSIGGMVWHDLCAIPYASGSPLEPGCVEVVGVDGGMVPAANGILEPGEPGFEGLLVELGAGACPSTGLATALTDPDGMYSFPDLPDGDYCVSVNALDPANALLIPGGWTYPIRDAEPATADVTLDPGETAGEVNFGWDYQFLPAPPALESSPTPVPTPTSVGAEILGFLWNDVCHYSTGPNNSIVLGQGCIGDPNGVWGANGVFDAGEPVFGGVTFRIAAGSCANPPYASAATNVAGYFGFVNVPPGSYCISLNILDPGNASRLIPGGSTTHSETGGQILIPFTIAPGDTLYDLAIGWEFQHLG